MYNKKSNRLRQNFILRWFVLVYFFHIYMYDYVKLNDCLQSSGDISMANSIASCVKYADNSYKLVREYQTNNKQVFAHF